MSQVGWCSSSANDVIEKLKKPTTTTKLFRFIYFNNLYSYEIVVTHYFDRYCLASTTDVLYSYYDDDVVDEDEDDTATEVQTINSFCHKIS